MFKKATPFHLISSKKLRAFMRLLLGVCCLIDYIKLYLNYPGKQQVFLRHQYDSFWPLLKRIAFIYRRVFIAKVPIITIVGSLGKTTTRRVFRTALFEKMPEQSFSNYGSCLAENILRISQKDKQSVLEVGISGKGLMHKYGHLIQPNVVVVTSIKSEHNRSFETLEETRNEKAKMVRALTKDGLALLNGDDPFVRWMANETKAEVLTFGFNEDNDVIGSEYKINWPYGSTLTVKYRDKQRNIKTKLIGKQTMYSLLAFMTYAFKEKLDLDLSLKRLEGLLPASQRMQPIQLKNDVTIIDDSFKGAIESMYASIDFLSDIPAQRKLFVLGQIEEPPGNQRDRYRELGDKLSQVADKLYFLGGDIFRLLRSRYVKGGRQKENIVQVKTNLNELIFVLKK